MSLRRLAQTPVTSMAKWDVILAGVLAFLSGCFLGAAGIGIGDVISGIAWTPDVMAAWAQALLSALAIVAAAWIFHAGERARVTEKHRDDYEYMVKAYYICVSAWACAHSAVDLRDLGPVSGPEDIEDWNHSFLESAEIIERGLLDLDRVDPVAVRLSAVTRNITSIRRLLGFVHSQVVNAAKKADFSRMSDVKKDLERADAQLRQMRSSIKGFAKYHALRRVERIR